MEANINLLPHGWKTEAAKQLGIHYNTVTNALKAKKGVNYERIINYINDNYAKPKTSLKSKIKSKLYSFFDKIFTDPLNKRISNSVLVACAIFILIQGIRFYIQNA